MPIRAMLSARPSLMRLAAPRSPHEDVRRREFIFNVLVLGSIALLFIAVILDTVHLFYSDPTTYKNDSLSLVAIAGVFAFFLSLYALTRAGYVRLGSYLLLGSLFGLATYMVYVWGFDVPAAALFYVLLIVMAGILIHTRAAFIAALAASLALAILGHAQLSQVLSSNSLWKQTPARYDDIVMTVLVLGIIVTVSWLGNREIERSLARARASRGTGR